MVLGYDQSRPGADNYGKFMDSLLAGLGGLGNDGLGLMLYGSYVRGDYTPGRSDIDAVLTFPHDVVIPKDFMHDASAVLCEALAGNNVPFQVCPADLATVRDGRFNSFTDDFYDYFQDEGRVVLGPDYRSQMACLPVKTGEESVLSHNLRKARQGLLFAVHNRKSDYRKLLEGFDATLSAASRGSKQVLYLVDGHLRKNRFSALAELPRHFPAVNAAPLERIRDLFHHPEKLDALYMDTDELMNVWNDAVTFFEEVIREYIMKYPRRET